MTWFCYLVQCADGTLYTGITTALARRLALHNAGRGAKYTRGRRPVRLVYVESHSSRAAASRREFAIRRMSRVQKSQLMASAGTVPGPTCGTSL
jgi:putative endonuclease